jgi:hypothetical protein
MLSSLAIDRNAMRPLSRGGPRQGVIRPQWYCLLVEAPEQPCPMKKSPHLGSTVGNERAVQGSVGCAPSLNDRLARPPGGDTLKSELPL